jgi:hypothetical protein
MLRTTLPLFAAVLSTSPALADWGENWGEMVWGSSTPPAAVPMTGWPGLFLLLTLLLVTALWKMKRVPRQVGLTLSLFLLVPFLIAPHISTWTGKSWYTFINGEVADANEVNGNFEALAYALDVTVPNSFANSGIADANEINSNFEVLKAAVEQFTTDAAAATAATGTAFSNGVASVDITSDNAAAEAAAAATAGSSVCAQVGGTWDPGTSGCTADAYNCFVAGFCSYAAEDAPPGEELDYTNVYEGHNSQTGGCDEPPRSDQWTQGEIYYDHAIFFENAFYRALCAQ